MNKLLKNKQIFKYIFYILIFILICTIIFLIFFKYISIEKFELNKCYIICKKNEYKYMEDYILSFYKQINAKILIFDNINELPEMNKIDTFIFIQSIPSEILNTIDSQNSNVYLVNTEQMSRDITKDRLHTFPKTIKILDYSIGNIKYYDKQYYIKFLSYQLNYDEIYNLPKPNDICIMFGESEYRRNIINQIINKGYNIDIISGWTKERDEKLFTYKILVNVSYAENCKLFETLRCDRCIFNKMIVISDMKEDIDTYYLKDYMIFEDYDKVSDKAIEVLNNYDMYYKKLGLDKLNLNALQIEPVSL